MTDTQMPKQVNKNKNGKMPTDTHISSISLLIQRNLVLYVCIHVCRRSTVYGDHPKFAFGANILLMWYRALTAYAVYYDLFVYHPISKYSHILAFPSSLLIIVLCW